MSLPPFHAWRPIQAPADPAALASPELRAFTGLWQRQRTRLKDSTALTRFLEKMNRWWSIETGVIERLYDLSAGVTVSLVEQGFITSLIPHGESTMDPSELVAILKDHREALDMVMDIVTGRRPFSVSWIKELQALFTNHQPTTRALTPDGRFIDVPLLRGEFKRQPNNPTRPDGKIHEYCPPEQVVSEMDRLIALYHALPPEFPDVRAAWLHHCFTQIHPFQDGNGRVARALASIDLIRAGLFPLLVQRSDRDKTYLPALEDADRGDLRPLVRLFTHCMERVLTRAISEAERVLDGSESLQSVVRAAQAKVEMRTRQLVDDRTLMAQRLETLKLDAEQEVQRIATYVESNVAHASARVDSSTPERAWWFRREIVELASQRSVWADLREPRHWIRLRLRDGGNTAIVVVLHFVGNPSPGSGLANIFIKHNDRHDETENQGPVVHLPIEPLLLIIDETLELQRQRLIEWLERALTQAIAQWTRYL